MKELTSDAPSLKRRTISAPQISFYKKNLLNLFRMSGCCARLWNFFNVRVTERTLRLEYIAANVIKADNNRTSKRHIVPSAVQTKSAISKRP